MGIQDGCVKDEVVKLYELGECKELYAWLKVCCNELHIQRETKTFVYHLFISVWYVTFLASITAAIKGISVPPN